MHIFISLFKIKFIRMTLVNKLIQDLSEQFSDTSSVYRIVCPQHKVKSSSITIYLTTLPPHTPSPSTIMLSVSVRFLCLFFLFVICCFQFYIPHMSEIIQFFFLTDLFCLALYSQNLSKLSQMALFNLFLCLSSIPLYMHQISFSQLFIKGHFVVFKFWPL